MRDYSLTHLTDAVLLRDLTDLVAQDRITMATLLAHIAEVDFRRLYVPAGHSSMHAYCVDELRLSEGAAYKRIRAARAAREFPALFPAVAEGRLHLAAVCLLAPHLAAENAEELMAEATHRRKSEVEAFLARRFPSAGQPESAKPTPAATLRAIPAPAPHPGLTSRMDDLLAPGSAENEPSVFARPVFARPDSELSPGTVGNGPEPQDGELSPGTVDAWNEPAPTPSERFLLKLVLDKELHDKLRYAQALLSHAVPSGDIAQVLGRALDALIPQLEKRKFGAVSRRSRRRESQPQQPQQPQRHQEPQRREPRPLAPRALPNPRPRFIPAPVRRAVWERDHGQCTFIGASGHRCETRKLLEFDHIRPVARGGTATVDGMRLRCRAHNQHEAERVFGTDFMSRKREESRAARHECSQLHST